MKRPSPLPIPAVGLVIGAAALVACAETALVPRADLEVHAARTCVGLADGKALSSVFQGITKAEPQERKVQFTPKVAYWQKRAVVLRKKAEPWMTAQYLQRLLDCDLARHEAQRAAGGPEHMLYVDRTRASVEEGRGAFLITLETDDYDRGLELISRAERLVASPPKSDEGEAVAEKEPVSR